MEYQEINARERAHCINCYLKRQKGFQHKRIIGISLYCIAIVIVCFFTVLFASMGSSSHSNSGIPNIAVGLLLGAAIGMIPFLIGQAIIIKAKKRFGFPFTERSNEFFRFGKADIQYGYHPTEPSDFNGMNVYQIKYSDIRNIQFDRFTKVLSIVGRGEIIIYDDLLMTLPNNHLSGKRFYENSEYQIMLATDHAQQIVDFLKEKAQGGN